jgi:hypothetical protein
MVNMDVVQTILKCFQGGKNTVSAPVPSILLNLEGATPSIMQKVNRQ